ncbi:HlyD family efflux transporter periplasmic adaptor subunit [Halobacteriovorax vibrionivorans]|uniref:HlyD family efflux transporter periplasmic adaptor subunit n=1 Tax=Halobacteriovorax vibrionivorans TaxID=2152716 RepID=A0ABY0II65_9BACT|nr:MULTISPECIES: HlyD family efflux transporter periplasmic adaptor subunit [Halobacteriovorax]RZF21828.1 HlyD family efflux transporter periplasmic adaptor subunit [Halobacteriovorax vibrionivorans]TGD48337.1 HlyD family efflux transporter periplasmic adaptor subunit [Halobacteriovorax sp. Y22]
MKKVYIALVIIVLIAVAIGARVFYFKKNFELISPKKGDVVEAIYGLGRVESDQEFNVKIGVLSIVEKLYVKEGQSVKKGDRLISFEGRVLFKAPFDGTVTLVANKEREIVLPQFTVLTLKNLNQKYVEVSLEQDAALRVLPKQRARLVFESQSQLKYEGYVKTIYPREGEFITRIEVEGLEKSILPGMTADVVIEVGKKKDVLLIPVKAISDGKVLRMRNKKREKVDVTTGNSDGMWVEVVSGDINLDDLIFIKR